MKIVLVRPNWNTRWLITPPLGLGYISAAAKQAGHECVIHDAWLLNQTPIDAVFDIAMHPRYDIIGVQLFHDTVEWAKEFIEYIHRYTTAKIMVGGPLVTVLGDEARKIVGADVGIAGEFDGDINMLLNISKHETGTFFTPKTDVNAIPIPDWDAMPLPAYWPYLYQVSTPVRGKRVGVIQRTRGCNFHCTFCAAGATMGHGNGLYFLRCREVRNDTSCLAYMDSNNQRNSVRNLHIRHG